MQLKLSALITVFLTSSLALASLVQPGDGPYYRLRRGRTLYIYEPGTRDFIDQLAAYHEAYRKMYDRSFNWKLDEEQDLILASPNQQIANAYATVVPNIKSLWYPSGAGMLEEMAESSWLLTLDSHETSHLYQLNPKGRLGSWLKPVFGNAMYIFPLVWPVFLQPNVLLPTSMLEGNAVLNESRVNQGGRLHSGEKRAMVLAEIAAGDVSATRLINDEFKYPFGEVAYLQGGYFQAHLAAKYGIEKTNSFYRAAGEHLFVPILLNKTFRDHFGSSYYQEVKEYLHALTPIAAKQQLSSGLPLVQTVFTGPLNHDAQRVFWVSTKGLRTPQLFVYDKSTRRLSERDLDIPLGKVFFEGETVRTAASDQNDLHHQTASLYGESAAMDPRYRDQIVSDQRAGKTVSLDARNSWLDPHILVNGENYDVGHSNPILDEAGNLYYFRQNGGERVLYRNREPVFKYNGFYGKLTEVAADGSIYFIGNTDYGSTLYRYAQGEIRRVLPSDRVIDARQIGAGEFLVIEVESRGNRMLIANAQEKVQAPVNYSYGFTTESVNPEPPTGQEATKNDERPYNSLRELRYSALNLNSTYSSKSGPTLATDLEWTDPLSYQELSLGYATGAHDDQVTGQYVYSRYSLEPFVSYWWKQGHYTAPNQAMAHSYEQETDVGLYIPLLRWHRWDAVWAVAGNYRQEDLHPNRDYLWGTLNSFNLKWAVPADLGFYSWREFDFGFTNRLSADSETWRKKHNTSEVSAKYTLGLPWQLYVTGAGSYAWGEDKDIDVQYNPNSTPDNIQVQRLTDGGDFRVQQAAVARLEVEKSFVVPAYSSRIPFGLHRIAPLVVAQGIVMDDDPSAHPPSMFEWGPGVDLDVLFLHKFSGRIRYLFAVDTADPNRGQHKLEFALKQTF